MNRYTSASVTFVLSVLLSACGVIPRAAAQPIPPDPSPTVPEPRFQQVAALLPVDEPGQGMSLLHQTAAGGGSTSTEEPASTVSAPSSDTGTPAPATSGPVPERDPEPSGRSDLVLRGRGIPGMKIRGEVIYSPITYLPFIRDYGQRVNGRVEADGTYRLHIPAVRDRLVMYDIRSVNLVILAPRPDGNGTLWQERSATLEIGEPGTIPFADLQMILLEPIQDKLSVMKRDGTRVARDDFSFYSFVKGRPGNHVIDIAYDAP